ncbi:lipopolysaccharide biosynthesis protein [Yoonia sp. SS1-5]|uniref:Lipopolysaccharide biosynthesis protein n=1 Tax=Yoonia rhodophyticola TaxID=3137370 RepID=A0AAN0MB07_9RHOB
MTNSGKNLVRKDLLLTLAASASLAFVLIVFNALAARLLGKEAFGILQTARNLAVLFVPVVTFSLAIALPRYMAEQDDKHGHVAAAGQIFIAILGITAAIAAALMVFPVLPTPQQMLVPFVFAICVTMAAVRLVESVLRGHRKIGLAAFVKGPVNGAVHIFAFVVMLLIPTWQFAAFGLIGGYAIAVVCGAILILRLRQPATSGTLTDIRRRLLVFGAGRTPGGVLKSLVFGVPFAVLSAKGAFEAAAVYAIGLYFIRIAEAIITGISPSIVFQSARIKKDEGEVKLSEFVNALLEGAVTMSIALLIFLLVWHVDIVTFLFGQGYENDMDLIALLAIALVPQCVFVVLRSVVDVTHDLPINTGVVAVAVIVQLLCLYIFSDSYPIGHVVTMATLIALFVIMAGTLLAAFPVLRLVTSRGEWAKIGATLVFLALVNSISAMLTAGIGAVVLVGVLNAAILIGSVVGLRHRWFFRLFSNRGAR